MYNNINVTEYFFDNLHIGNTELLFCGHQDCVPDHSYGPFVRTHYLLIYIYSGKGTFKNKHAIYNLSAGSSFCIFPGEMTFYQADHNNPWSYFWIAFNGQINLHDAEHFLLRASISRVYPVHTAKNNARLSQLYLEMFRLCQDSNNYIDLKLLSLFLDIMYQYSITTNSSQQSLQSTPTMPSYIDLALTYIQSNYQENISVSNIARHLGISREYFSKLFKKQFSITPAHFIRDYRLKCSTTLLMTTDYPILQISYLVGFNDYNYYSNQFKEIYGISPSHYRKSGRKSGLVPDPFRNNGTS